MFSPKYWALCRVSIDGYVDIESGHFYISGSKYKEASCNFFGRNKPYAEDIMTSLVRTTDISENELTLSIARYQAEYKALKAQLRLAQRREEREGMRDEKIAVR